MKRFLTVIDYISEWSGKIFSFLSLLAIVVVVHGVVMRYCFNAPTIWSLELTIYLCAGTYLVGGAYAHLYNSHIRIDALYSRWTPRIRAIIDLVTFPVFIISITAMGWAGTNWTIKAIVKDATSGSVWDPAIWPVRLLIPLGCLLLLLQGLARFVRDFGIARTGKAREEDAIIVRGVE